MWLDNAFRRADFVTDFLLSNNHVNSIISHQFDFSDEEVTELLISIYYWTGANTRSPSNYLSRWGHSEGCVEVITRQASLWP